MAAAAVVVGGARLAVAAEGAPGCAARPVVEEFLAALAAGDLDAVDVAVAADDDWRRYSVGDRAGRRLSPEAMVRDTLRGYFAERIRQRETMELVRLDENGNGNFSMLVVRRADDLGDARPVQRLGKGWVSCRTGKLAVWSLGGAPPPASFGPAPEAPCRSRRGICGRRHRRCCASCATCTRSCRRFSTSPGHVSCGRR